MLSAHARTIRKLGLALLGIVVVGLLILSIKETPRETFGPIIVPAPPQPDQTVSPPPETPPADAAEADAGGLTPNREPDRRGANGGSADDINRGDADVPAPVQPAGGDGRVTPAPVPPTWSRDDDGNDDGGRHADDDADDDDDGPAAEDDE